MSDETTAQHVPGTAEPRAGAPDRLLASLSERIGARFSVSTVYGTPVERDGITVIPVAAARFAMGGGGGSDPEKGQEGEGGGVAGSVTPAGYIELKDGRSRHVPLVHPARMLMIVCGTVLAGLLIMRRAAGRSEPRTRRWR